MMKPQTVSRLENGLRELRMKSLLGLSIMTQTNKTRDDSNEPP